MGSIFFSPDFLSFYSTIILRRRHLYVYRFLSLPCTTVNPLGLGHFF